MFKNFLFVALGGALGASLRYGVALLGTYLGSSSQRVTFLINIVGSFLLGFLTAMTPSGSLMMFAAIGVCGSFTTFSTYSVHSVALLQEGRYGAAVVYIIGTVILCLILAWAGLIVGQRINSQI